MVLVSEKTHFRNSLLFGFFEITVQFTRDLKNVQNEIYSNAYAENLTIHEFPVYPYLHTCVDPDVYWNRTVRN